MKMIDDDDNVNKWVISSAAAINCRHILLISIKTVTKRSHIWHRFWQNTPVGYNELLQQLQYSLNDHCKTGSKIWHSHVMTCLVISTSFA